VDFDKYTALSMAESLASDAKQNSHPRPPSSPWLLIPSVLHRPLCTEGVHSTARSYLQSE